MPKILNVQIAAMRDTILYILIVAGYRNKKEMKRKIDPKLNGWNSWQYCNYVEYLFAI